MPEFPPGTCQKGGAASRQVNIDSAREFYAPILPLVAELHGRGLSLRQIARELEARGIKTRQEWPHWSAMQVRRVVARATGRPWAAKRPAEEDAASEFVPLFPPV